MSTSTFPVWQWFWGIPGKWFRAPAQLATSTEFSKTLACRNQRNRTNRLGGEQRTEPGQELAADIGAKYQPDGDGKDRQGKQDLEKEDCHIAGRVEGADGVRRDGERNRGQEHRCPNLPNDV